MNETSFAIYSSILNAASPRVIFLALSFARSEVVTNNLESKFATAVVRTSMSFDRWKYLTITLKDFISFFDGLLDSIVTSLEKIPSAFYASVEVTRDGRYPLSPE